MKFLQKKEAKSMQDLCRDQDQEHSGERRLCPRLGADVNNRLASAGGCLCSLENFLTLQHLRALISQMGNQMTTSPVEWCPAGPRQAHWHPASFPPSEHRGQRGTWAREQRYICAHCNLISSVSAMTVHPAAAADSAPGSLRPLLQAHPGL